MGQQTGTGVALVNRPGRQRRLNNRLAARARPARPDDPVDHETPGNVLWFLRDIFARRKNRIIALLMSGQRFAAGEC